MCFDKLKAILETEKNPYAGITSKARGVDVTMTMTIATGRNVLTYFLFPKMRLDQSITLTLKLGSDI